MFKLGKNEYKLCCLDTNALARIVEEPRIYGRGFITVYPPDQAIPCFSPYSLFELRARREIFDKFVKFFALYPCMVLKNEEQLFNDELASYPDPSGVIPVLLGFSAFNKSRGCDLESLLSRSFNCPDILQRELAWPALKKGILDSVVALKSNFSPKGKRFTTKDAARFVRNAAIEQIALRAGEWVRRRLGEGHVPRTDAFPSVKMSLFTVFFRLYEPDRRTPEPQDVFDILISASVPYLDAIIVENFQAEIVRKVAALDPFVRHVEVRTLRDLRAFSCATQSS